MGHLSSENPGSKPTQWLSQQKTPGQLPISTMRQVTYTFPTSSLPWHSPCWWRKLWRCLPPVPTDDLTNHSPWFGFALLKPLQTQARFPRERGLLYTNWSVQSRFAWQDSPSKAPSSISSRCHLHTLGWPDLHHLCNSQDATQRKQLYTSTSCTSRCSSEVSDSIRTWLLTTLIQGSEFSHLFDHIGQLCLNKGVSHFSCRKRPIWFRFTKFEAGSNPKPTHMQLTCAQNHLLGWLAIISNVEMIGQTSQQRYYLIWHKK